MSKLVSSVEEYRLIIEGELLDLVRQAIALEQQCDQAGKSRKHQSSISKLEERLYDLYQEIGWSVVSDIKSLPF